MIQPIGHTSWAIAEDYIPAYSNGPELSRASALAKVPQLFILYHTVANPDPIPTLN